MKFYININQAILSKYNLDLKDAAILEYIKGWCMADDKKVNQITKEIDGALYKFTWINFNHLIKEMPLLGIKQKASISERIEKIRLAGFIGTHQEKDNTMYIRLLPKLKELEFEGGAVSLNEQPVSLNEQGLLAKTNSTNNILSLTNNTGTPSAASLVVPDSAFEDISYLTEEEAQLKKPSQNKQYDKALTFMAKRRSELTGEPFSFTGSRIGDYAALKAIKKLMSNQRTYEIWEEMCENEWWQEKGFTLWDVIKQFKKKGK